MIMAEIITIEGSISPSVYLARGERVTVRADDVRARNLVLRGFANVVSTDTDEAEPVLPEPLPTPARNASRDDWAEYLAAGAFGIVTEGKGRDELLAEYDDYIRTHDVPAEDDAENPEG
jgi:hypothetical protein